MDTLNEEEEKKKDGRLRPLRHSTMYIKCLYMVRMTSWSVNIAMSEYIYIYKYTQLPLLVDSVLYIKWEKVKSK